LKTLPGPIACSLLLKYGRHLVNFVPNEAVSLIENIIELHKPEFDVFIPLFIDNSQELKKFLHRSLQMVGDRRLIGSGVVMSYLELLLREYRDDEISSSVKKNCHLLIHQNKLLKKVVL